MFHFLDICRSTQLLLLSSYPYHEKINLPGIADGDEDAFREFYEFYAGQLRPFLLKYTGSQTHMEDIIQETFIRVWVNRDRLSEIDNIGGWIYRIASRVYLDHVGRELRIRQRRDSFGEVLHGSEPAVSAERTRLQEMTNCIQRVLRSLPEQRRKIYRLNRELDMKPAQIAAHLNMPVGTVKNLLSQALREIRNELIASGYGPVSVYILFCILFLKKIL